MNLFQTLFRRKQRPLDNVTPRVQWVFVAARNEADRRFQSYVGAEHLWGGLLRIGEGVAIGILKARGIDLLALRKTYEAATPSNEPRDPPLTLPYTPALKAVLKAGEKEASRLGFTYFGTEHLLLVFLNRKGLAYDCLTQVGLNLADARSEVQKRIHQSEARGTTPNRPTQ